MKKTEIKIGETYMAKVTDSEVPVRIESDNKNGGWDAKNIATGRTCRIRSGRRLIRACSQSDLAAFAKSAKPNRRARGGKVATTTAKTARRRNRAKPRTKVSGLTAAAIILAANPGIELRAKEIIEQAADQGLWKSRAATPHATIYAAMIREINSKGDDSRFKRGEAKGTFVTNLTSVERAELVGQNCDS